MKKGTKYLALALVCVLLTGLCAPAMAFGSWLGGLGDALDGLFGQVEEAPGDGEDGAFSHIPKTFSGRMVEVRLSSGAAVQIHEDFKKLMDDYEAFFDAYAAVAADPLGNYLRLAEMLGRYAQMEEELDYIGTLETSTAEDLYYLEVLTRINQKLLTVLD